MIILRTGAGAFLRNSGKILLIKRSKTKKIAPGVWSCIGGHMEPREINNPLGACLREVEEETGIPAAEIHSLELLYIMIRRRGNEISHYYIYFGETRQTDLVQTEEGHLLWIPEEELANREYTETFAAMIDHYISRKEQDRALYVGVAENESGKLRMNWAKCN